MGNKKRGNTREDQKPENSGAPGNIEVPKLPETAMDLETPIMSPILMNQETSNPNEEDCKVIPDKNKDGKLEDMDINPPVPTPLSKELQDAIKSLEKEQDDKMGEKEKNRESSKEKGNICLTDSHDSQSSSASEGEDEDVNGEGVVRELVKHVTISLNKSLHEIVKESVNDSLHHIMEENRIILEKANETIKANSSSLTQITENLSKITLQDVDNGGVEEEKANRKRKGSKDLEASGKGEENKKVKEEEGTSEKGKYVKLVEKEIDKREKEATGGKEEVNQEAKSLKDNGQEDAKKEESGPKLNSYKCTEKTLRGHWCATRTHTMEQLNQHYVDKHPDKAKLPWSAGNFIWAKERQEFLEAKALGETKEQMIKLSEQRQAILDRNPHFDKVLGKK